MPLENVVKAVGLPGAHDGEAGPLAGEMQRPLETMLLGEFLEFNPEGVLLEFGGNRLDDHPHSEEFVLDIHRLVDTRDVAASLMHEAGQIRDDSRPIRAADEKGCMRSGLVAHGSDHHGEPVKICKWSAGSSLPRVTSCDRIQFGSILHVRIVFRGDHFGDHLDHVCHSIIDARIDSGHA